jgi:hypothetical protein
MNYGSIHDQQLARAGYASNHFALAMAFRSDAVHHWAWDSNARKRSLPNPFTPLCEAWMLGYAIDGFDEDALVLIALDPEVTRDELTAEPKRRRNPCPKPDGGASHRVARGLVAPVTGRATEGRNETHSPIHELLSCSLALSRAAMRGCFCMARAAIRATLERARDEPNQR